MNGEVDVSGRALMVLSIRPSHGADAVSLQAWVDTAFTGELVIPQATITRLGLPQSAAVMAGLADGTQVVLDTFSCVIDWFGQERVVEVVENDGNLPLLGVGSISYTRLMSMAQVWLERLRAGAGPASPLDDAATGSTAAAADTAASAALRRMPRALFEYQP